MKKQMILAACLLVFICSRGQQGKNNNDNNANTFYVMVSGGLSLFGPTQNIKDFMRANGYGETSPGGWFGGPVDHPRTTSYPCFHVQGSYFLKGNTGVTLGYGLINHVEVDGYSSSGYGSYIFLRSRLHLISLAYSRQTSDGRSLFSIGPAILIHSAKDESAGSHSAKTTNLKPAIQVAYSPKLYNGRKWFVALDAHCSVSPKSEIGPFNGGEFSATLPATKVNTTSLYIGLAVGTKL